MPPRPGGRCRYNPHGPWSSTQSSQKLLVRYVLPFDNTQRVRNLCIVPFRAGLSRAAPHGARRVRAEVGAGVCGILRQRRQFEGSLP